MNASASLSSFYVTTSEDELLAKAETEKVASSFAAKRDALSDSSDRKGTCSLERQSN